MNPAIIYRPVLALLLFTAAASAGGAQTVAIPPAKVPELFEGEMEDIGPQYLLVAAPKVRPVEVWTDVELTSTSNATLAETGRKASTLTSAQAGGTWHFTPRSWHGGRLSFEAGAKAQTYRYGLLAGTKTVVNFLEIDRNNFDLLGAHAQAAWQRETTVLAATVRGASLRNRGNGRVFYEELALELQGFRQWSLTPRRTASLGFEGATRWSRTDSFGLLPAGWNDRAELGVIAVLEQQLGARWRLQPLLRVLGSRYTHRDRDRSDVHASARLTLIATLRPQLEVRLGLGYDRRDSSEPVMADYEKLDLALAASGRWRF